MVIPVAADTKPDRFGCSITGGPGPFTYTLLSPLNVRQFHDARYGDFFTQVGVKDLKKQLLDSLRQKVRDICPIGILNEDTCVLGFFGGASY